MPLELKSWACIDVDANLDTWVPDDSENVNLLVDLEIGHVGSEAADLYSCHVSTAESIARIAAGVRSEPYSPIQPIVGRAHYVFAEFEGAKIRQFFEKLVLSCSGNTYKEEAEQLQRYFRWEFEGYD